MVLRGTGRRRDYSKSGHESAREGEIREDCSVIAEVAIGQVTEREEERDQNCQLSGLQSYLSLPLSEKRPPLYIKTLPLYYNRYNPQS